MTLFPDEKPEEVVKKEEEKSFEISGTWWTLGVLAGLFGAQTMSAIAADESVTAAVTAASKEAPGWVAPSVLAFPVVSYFLFTLYRNKVRHLSHFVKHAACFTIPSLYFESSNFIFMNFFTLLEP